MKKLAKLKTLDTKPGGFSSRCPFSLTLPLGLWQQGAVSCSNSCFFLVLCFSLGIYTSYKTFLHKDKTLIKRLLKVSTSHPVLGGKTVPRARSEQAQLCKGAEFAVWDGLVHTGTRLSCQV